MRWRPAESLRGTPTSHDWGLIVAVVERYCIGDCVDSRIGYRIGNRIRRRLLVYNLP